MFGQALRHGKRKSDVLSRELDRYPKHVAADFRCCDAGTLRRYIARFKLQCANDSSTADMARVVARHFNGELDVKEDEVVGNFVKYINEYPDDPTSKRARATKRYGTRSTRNDAASDEEEAPGQTLYCICNRPSFGEMIGCDNDNCKIEWFHVGCVGIEPNSVKGREWYCEDCRAQIEADKEVEREREARRDREKDKFGTTDSAGSSRPGSRASLKRADDPDEYVHGDGGVDGDPPKMSLTYSEMITEALAAIPGERGSFKEICHKIQSKYNGSLNWKPESDVRKSPVWKSSVRKILLSNAKFRKVDDSTYVIVRK